MSEPRLLLRFRRLKLLHAGVIGLEARTLLMCAVDVHGLVGDELTVGVCHLENTQEDVR